jgi:hypothetical protein
MDWTIEQTITTQKSICANCDDNEYGNNIHRRWIMTKTMHSLPIIIILRYCTVQILSLWKEDGRGTNRYTHTQCSSTFSMEMFGRKISKISSRIMQRAGNEKEEEDQMRYHIEEKCITGIITLLWLLLLAPENAKAAIRDPSRSLKPGRT